jgi:hypothetical protein
VKKETRSLRLGFNEPIPVQVRVYDDLAEVVKEFGPEKCLYYLNRSIAMEDMMVKRKILKNRQCMLCYKIFSRRLRHTTVCSKCWKTRGKRGW